MTGRIIRSCVESIFVVYKSLICTQFVDKVWINHRQSMDNLLINYGSLWIT